MLTMLYFDIIKDMKIKQKSFLLSILAMFVVVGAVIFFYSKINPFVNKTENMSITTTNSIYLKQKIITSRSTAFNDTGKITRKLPLSEHSAEYFYKGFVGKKNIEMLNYPSPLEEGYEGVPVEHYNHSGLYVYEGKSEIVDKFDIDLSKEGKYTIILHKNNDKSKDLKLVGYNCGDGTKDICSSDDVYDWSGKEILPFRLNHVSEFEIIF